MGRLTTSAPSCVGSRTSCRDFSCSTRVWSEVLESDDVRTGCDGDEGKAKSLDVGCMIPSVAMVGFVEIVVFSWTG